MNVRFLPTLALLTSGSVGIAGIENPTCERIGPGVYTLDYQATLDAGAVDVFASARPDRVDSAKPLITILRTPAEVSVPERFGRVYFHLKPASGATRVVSIRRLPLEGAANFRDLGGYRTSDGHYVRWGLIYRSNHLVSLTVGDYEYLRSLGIRLVCDVRTEGERVRSPTHWIGNAPEFLSVPIGRDPAAPTTVQANNYAIDFARQYGTVLRRLAVGDLPALEHCSSGKDRTGVFSAILLTALGVPHDTVLQDYLLTTNYVLAADSIERTRADLQKILGLRELPDVPYVESRMTARPETLESVFDSITRRYGAFDRYLRNGLRISAAELAMLRGRLLER